MRTWWGIEVRNRTIRSTEFVCPRCGLDRDGREVEPQRWFTVLSVPVVPLATLELRVVCDACSHSSDLGVLDVPTTTLLERWVGDAVRLAAAAIVRASEPIGGHGVDRTSPTRSTAVALVRANVPEYGFDDLDQDVRASEELTVLTALHRLRHELTAHGKQGLLHRLAAVAMATEPLTLRQRQALVDVGVALGMPAPHINGVLAVATVELEAA
jgi:hypothetical protein